MKKSIKLILITILFISCNNREEILDKSKMLGNDYRLFQNTPAWLLAKAVENGDTSKIINEVFKKGIKVDYKEPIFGNTLLMLAIANSNYTSAKTLLNLHSDPNLTDNYRGSSAIIDASENEDPKYLSLVLKYKGNPNAIESAPIKKGDEVRNTALNTAISLSNRNALEKVKLLVDAGANVNYSNGESTQTPLSYSIIAGKMDVLLYLLQKGADYRGIIYKLLMAQMFIFWEH